ncbi:MAG: diguanylate cyclase [Proteobacteria bacterium]|nr:diguanylate cyclase [Pseudomonadota bacterium]MBU1686971.1 diguanylate cyclase [Pseudomonadota bacterium]
MHRFYDSPTHKLSKSVVAHFLRLNIAYKMLMGFVPLLILLGIISLFALTNLNHLNSLNESILAVDIPASNAAEEMKEIILVQESFVRRFILLKDQEMLKIYSDKGTDFFKRLDLLKSLPLERHFPLESLEEAYNSYAGLLLAGIKTTEDDPEQATLFDQTLREKQVVLMDLLKQINDEAIRDQNEKTGITASIGNIAFKVALNLCIIGLILSVTAAALVTNNIVKAVRKLQYATEMIAQGRFDYRPDIKNKDELGDLADAFVMMATRLKKLEEMYLDASPLTRLPGGVAIENILKKKIESGQPLAFCLMDLDNFKSYNDAYGYSKGNAMIQKCATIIEEVVTELGTPENFVGHIGGDDFAVITTPDVHEAICNKVIERFDSAVPDFYNSTDRERGTILGVNRQGQSIAFPLASISIAVVTNQQRNLQNHIQVGEIAAELKEHAKSIKGSTYITDQRQTEPAAEPNEGGKLISFRTKEM